MLIKNIGRLITMEPAKDREGPLGVIEDAVLLLQNEKIAWVGKKSEWENKKQGKKLDVVDANGGVVLPGFIDCHTHLVFAGSREKEFALRAKGISYEEIATQGGGILSTVAATREASEEDLYKLAKERADRALSYGFTILEIKTGYGLDVATELKMLHVIERLEENHVIHFVPTFLGAHTFPKEFRGNREGYNDLILNEMLPAFAKRQVSFIDIFVEKTAFAPNEARKILSAGKKMGMKIRMHVDQLHDGGGAMLAAEVGAVSADHLENISDAGILALKKSGVIAVLLPGAAFFLGGKKYPPARKLLEVGVPVALSTDFNPGTSPCLNPFWIGTIAATQMQMTLEEVLLGFTKIPAQVLGVEKERGSIAPGKSADLLLLNATHECQPFYRCDQSFVEKVFIRGKLCSKER